MPISKPYTIGDTKEAKENRDATYDRVFGRKITVESGNVYRLFIDEGKVIKIGDEDGNELKSIPKKDKRELDLIIEDGVV